MLNMKNRMKNVHLEGDRKKLKRNKSKDGTSQEQTEKADETTDSDELTED